MEIANYVDKVRLMHSVEAFLQRANWYSCSVIFYCPLFLISFSFAVFDIPHILRVTDTCIQISAVQLGLISSVLQQPSRGDWLENGLCDQSVVSECTPGVGNLSVCVDKYILLFVGAQFYRALNIRVPLIGLEIWTDRDQCIVNEEPNATLWSFLQWRQKLKSRKKHDNAQLLTWVTWDTSSSLSALITIESNKLCPKIIAIKMFFVPVLLSIF